VEIDTTTLILLALAALPWLAPFLQSITFPGCFGVVLRDIHDRVERVETKVVESGRQVQELAAKLDLLVGADPISSGKRDEIAAHIAGLGAYLHACGLPLPSTNPTINIDAKTPLPYYLPGDDPQLVIPPDASAEMIQGVLWAPRRRDRERFARARDDLVSGRQGFGPCGDARPPSD
jgi:hypothetical protein